MLKGPDRDRDTTLSANNSGPKIFRIFIFGHLSFGRSCTYFSDKFRTFQFNVAEKNYSEKTKYRELFHVLSLYINNTYLT